MTSQGPQTTKGNQPASSPTKKGALPLPGTRAWWLLALVAIVILVTFPIVVGTMLDHISDDQTSWDRRFLIFSSVEAIAFAAVGFLFGQEVHRQRAEKAEEQVDGAQDARSIAEKVASREETLSNSNRNIIEKAQAAISGVASEIADQESTLSRDLPSVPGSNFYQLFVADDPQKANEGLAMLRTTVVTGDVSESFDKLRDDAGLQSLSQKEINLEPLAEARGKIEEIRGMLEAAQ